MKIFSKKKYEELVQRLTDIALDLEQAKSDNNLLETQVKVLMEQLNDSKFSEIKLGEDLDEAKKEVKRLKTLLTKNKINYKKEKQNVRNVERHT